MKENEMMLFLVKNRPRYSMHDTMSARILCICKYAGHVQLWRSCRPSTIAIMLHGQTVILSCA